MFACLLSFLSICLFACLPVYCCICLHVCLSVCLCVCLSVCLYICLPVVCLSMSVFFDCLFVCLPICLSAETLKTSLVFRDAEQGQNSSGDPESLWCIQPPGQYSYTVWDTDFVQFYIFINYYYIHKVCRFCWNEIPAIFSIKWGNLFVENPKAKQCHFVLIIF